MSILESTLMAFGLAVLIGWMVICIWHIVENLKNHP